MLKIPTNKENFIYNYKGYTVIELIIVVGIILVTSNILILKFPINEKNKLNEICLQLKTDIRYAQQLAMLQNKEYIIKIGNNNREYSIFKKVTKNSIETIKTVSLIPNISFIEINITQINFTKRGTVEQAATIYLESQNYRQEMTLALASGRVAIDKIIPK